jgi:hypothetical protein
VQLDLKSQMLCRAGWIFMNGEAHQANEQDYRLLRELADRRSSSRFMNFTVEAVDLLYRWYLDGYISLIRTGGKP